ncbi:hypothetical protein D3C86_1116170 [compost metagenome]
MIIMRLPMKHPVTRALFAGLFAASLTACSPSIAGSNPDTDTKTNTDTNTQTEVKIDGEVRTLMIDADAAKKSEYHYFSFAEAKEVTVATPEDSTAWDLGFQALNTKLNGGIHGKGGVSITRLADQDFDALKQAPTATYLTDATGDSKTVYALKENGSWYTYNSTTHVVSINPNVVYVMKTTAGKYMKVQFLSYEDENGTSRMVTFKWAEIEAPKAE